MKQETPTNTKDYSRVTDFLDGCDEDELDYAKQLIENRSEDENAVVAQGQNTDEPDEGATQDESDSLVASAGSKKSKISKPNNDKEYDMAKLDDM